MGIQSLPMEENLIAWNKKNACMPAMDITVYCTVYSFIQKKIHNIIVFVVRVWKWKIMLKRSLLEWAHVDFNDYTFSDQLEKLLKTTHQNWLTTKETADSKLYIDQGVGFSKLRNLPLEYCDEGVKSNLKIIIIC